MNSHRDGIRKAAILVTCLDTAAADRLLDQMPPEQAAEVRRMVMELGDVDPTEQQRVMEEFCRIGPMTPARQPSGIELDARRPRAAAAQTAPQPDVSRPFGFLQDAEADKLARILAGERPQTIALVLAHLQPEQAGAMLSRLQPILQVDVVRRLVDLEETDPEILREVEAAIQSRLAKQVHIGRRRVAGIQAISGILRACDGPLGMQLYDVLSAYDRRLADKIDLPSVAFEDLGRLDDASLASLFSSVGPETVRLAMFGAEPSLVDRALRHIPQGETEAVRREIDFPGPIRLSDVDAARKQLTEAARRLAFQGRIRPPRSFPLDAAA